MTVTEEKDGNWTEGRQLNGKAKQLTEWPRAIRTRAEWLRAEWPRAKRAIAQKRVRAEEGPRAESPTAKRPRAEGPRAKTARAKTARAERRRESVSPHDGGHGNHERRCDAGLHPEFGVSCNKQQQQQRG